MANSDLMIGQVPTQRIRLWPGTVPAETRARAESVISDDRGGNVTRIAEVTNPVAALMDAQRAIRLVRSGAGKSHFIPQKVGIMGFSAGGSLSARASTRFSENTYKPVDKIDTVSARPDYTLLIYPAYLDEGPNRSLTPELIVTGNTPPMFLFETADDPYGNSALVMAGALRDQGVPVEMHLLPAGGHGYGVRPGNAAATVWPGLAAGWQKRILAEKE